MAKLILDTRAEAERSRIRVVTPLQFVLKRLFDQERELLSSGASAKEIGVTRRSNAETALNKIQEAHRPEVRGMHLLQWALVTALEKAAVVVAENADASPAMRKRWRDKVISDFVGTLATTLRELVPVPKGRPITRTEEEKKALRLQLENAFPKVKATLVRSKLPNDRKNVIAKMARRKWGEKKEFLSRGTIDHLLSPRKG